MRGMLQLSNEIGIIVPEKKVREANEFLRIYRDLNQFDVAFGAAKMLEILGLLEKEPQEAATSKDSGNY